MAAPKTKKQAQELLWNLSDETDPWDVDKAIALGADVNAPEPQTDRTPLMILCEDMEDRRAETKKIMSELLYAGADPLGGDCAFHRAISNGSQWQVGTIVARALREDLRGDFGEHVFHVFAQMIQDGEHCTMLRRALQDVKDLEANGAVSEVDNDGNSPLHTLWLDGAILDPILGVDGKPYPREDEAVEAHWFAAYEFWKHGCALDQRNKAGQTPAQLIRQHMEAGFPQAEHDDMRDDFFADLKTAMEHSALDAHTVHATSLRSPRRV